ncbi:putative acyltransferase 3 domain-containing protein [Septoria linicola]|nr:putative acyltransferase 3 domain-containing protein [Septoria linicola]
MASSRDPDVELDSWEDKTLPSTLDDIAAEEDPLAPSNSLNVTHQSEKPVDKKKNTAYLDGLRGLAALLVYIYHHVSWYFGPTDDIINGWGANGNHYFFQLPFIRLILTGGNAGVVIFFVLSGYVLSISPLRNLRDGHLRQTYRALVSSVIRRPIRLYLPVIGVSLFFVIGLHLPFGLAPKLAWPEPKETLWMELKQWVYELAIALQPSTKPDVLAHWFVYDPPVYTIPVELVGSMLIFSVLAISGDVTMRMRVIVYSVMYIVFLFVYQWAMACFMAGILLAINDLKEPSNGPSTFSRFQLSARGKKIMQHVALFTGWYLLCQTAGMRDTQVSSDTPGWWLLTKLIPPIYYDDPDKEYWRWWHTHGAFLVVYGVLRISWIQRFFSSRPLKYLGRISFSMYLVHGPLMWTLGDRVYRFFGHITMPEMTTMWDEKLPIPEFGLHAFTTRFLVAQAFILPMTFAFGHLGTILFDDPSVKLGKFVVGRLGLDGKKR